MIFAFFYDSPGACSSYKKSTCMPISACSFENMRSSVAELKLQALDKNALHGEQYDSVVLLPLNLAVVGVHEVESKLAADFRASRVRLLAAQTQHRLVLVELLKAELDLQVVKVELLEVAAD